MSGIEVMGVTKSYEGAAALSDVNLTFEKNKIYALLGRNGAGKSTLLNIIANRIFADSGQVLADGQPVAENDAAQKKIYLMSEANCYPEKMKVRETFRWSGEFYPHFDMEYAEELSEMFELNTNKRVKALSTGYRSVFKLITALSVNVPYCFLDEPVLGLDANHRDLFYRMLLECYGIKPFTVILSTHLIEEVSNVIEEIVIIDKGKVLRNESRENLLAGGCTVSGPREAVLAYIKDKNVIGSSQLGGLLTADLLDEDVQTELPAGLERSALDLQHLFIRLTDHIKERD